VLAFVQEHTEYQTAQLAGNSVHIDRLFLQRWMPELLEHLHYRIMDVSSLKECCRCAWSGFREQEVRSRVRVMHARSVFCPI
jgi:oligoribonuclease (3'-5' exoribonuclease)